MKLRKLFVLCISYLAAYASATPIEREVNLKTGNGVIHGTLLLPSENHKGPVALVVGGSGPTDRNGNSPGAQSDALLSLAQGLGRRGIASLRYDKRGVGASKTAANSELELRFDTYVTDAAAWLNQLRKQGVFSKIVIVGHSEGSLIGMLASREGNADAYISIAGPAEGGAKLLSRQLLGKLPPNLYSDNERILSSLLNATIVSDVPPELHMLYRPSVQPYLVSWFAYDPVQVMTAVKVPATIIQGDADLQVSVEDARRLHAANPASKLRVISGMNHVMKMASGTIEQQIGSYTTSAQPVAEPLIDAVYEAIVKAPQKP